MGERRRAVVCGTTLALVLVWAPWVRALPDIAPEISEVAVDFDATVAPADVDEGCAGATTGRVLVNFTTTTRSLGPDDLYMGDPGCPNCSLNPGAPCANPLYVCGAAHGHPHFEGFAKAELLDANGAVVVTGTKQGFCLEDFGCADPKYDCGSQGITVGCVDVYASGLPCQYLDITDVHLPDGDYTLRVTQDPQNRIPEANESNNVATATVHLGPPTLPPPPTCPVYTATDVPQPILDFSPTTSVVQDPRAGIVERVRIVDLHGTHSYMQDLAFTVTSPAGGSSVVVMDHVCGDTDDFVLDLADGAATPIPCPPSVGGLHKPSEALASFAGESAAGAWTLTVLDSAGGDVGTLGGWGLEVCTRCGNGMVDVNETCDDGNAVDGDCCSADCQSPAVDGTECENPPSCIVGGVCGGGACGGGTVSCDPCLTCDPPFGCIPPANVQCDLAPPRSASVTLNKHPADAAHDAIAWKWRSSLPVALLDYGSPTTVTDLILCIFDRTGLRMSATVPAAGTCRGKPCWSQTPVSLKYNDRDAAPEGITRLTATAGAAGQPRITVRGKGEALAMPPLGFSNPVTVRLKRDVGPVCWQARFPNASRNDQKQYRATLRD